MSLTCRRVSSRGKMSDFSISTVAGVRNRVTEKPRVISLTKGKDGYGFFLKMLWNSPMQCITDVERNSVAERAGLRNGDVVACVNGQDVMHASHDQCVKMIRDSGDSVKLTVASKAVMDVFYHHNITVEPELPENWDYLNDSTFHYTNAAFEDAPKANETSFGGLEGGVSALMRVNGEASTNTSSNLHSSQYKPVNLQSLDTSILNSEKSPEPPRIYDLTKDSDGYGFLLLRTQDVGGHYLTDVKPDGPAGKSGIRNGDRLLEVNNISIGFKTHEEVVSLISSDNAKVTLTVLSEQMTTNQARSSSSQEQELHRIFELVKGTSGYGFTLLPATGTSSHIVENVEKHEAADIAGMRMGDRLLEVNNISVIERTHDEVMQLIEESESKVTLLVARDSLPTPSIEIKSNTREDYNRRSSSSLTMYEYRILKTPDEQFEFFLAVDPLRNVQVLQSLTPGGPAHRCGLRNGDVVIEVNGVNVENKPHSEVVALIRQSMPSNEVKLLVSGEKRSLFSNKKQQQNNKETCLIS